MNTEWNEFENAATYAYARTLVEEKYRSQTAHDFESVYPTGRSAKRPKDDSAIEVRLNEHDGKLNEMQARMREVR